MRSGTIGLLALVAGCSVGCLVGCSVPAERLPPGAVDPQPRRAVEFLPDDRASDPEIAAPAQIPIDPNTTPVGVPGEVIDRSSRPEGSIEVGDLTSEVADAAPISEDIVPPGCGDQICQGFIGEDCGSCAADCGACAPDPATVHAITNCCPNEYVEVDLTNGDLTHVSDVGDASIGFVTTHALDLATHRLFLARVIGSQWEVAIIDTATGVLTSVPVGERIGHLAFDSVDGELYAISQTGSDFNFVRIDLSTGAFTQLTPLAADGRSFYSASAIDSATHRFFFEFNMADVHHLATIDTQTGAMSDVIIDDAVFSLGFDITGNQLFGVSGIHDTPDENDLELIDPTTGAQTALDNIGGWAFSFASVSAADPSSSRVFIERFDPAAQLIIVDTQNGAITRTLPLARNLMLLIAE